MNKLTLISFITSSIFLFGCKNESEHLKDKTQKKNEIVNIISYFETTIPVDGNYDMEEDLNNTKQIVEIETVKNNKVFWCYDTMNLLKIEILGYVSDATILFKDSNNTEKKLLEHTTIDGAYSIVPSESNGIIGGKIIVKSGDEILKEITIEYEGCL
jgi:hypothetical protein